MDPAISYERFLHQEIDKYYFETKKECRGCFNCISKHSYEDSEGKKYCSESCFENFQKLD